MPPLLVIDDLPGRHPNRIRQTSEAQARLRSPQGKRARREGLQLHRAIINFNEVYDEDGQPIFAQTFDPLSPVA